MPRQLSAMQTSAGEGTRLWPLNMENVVSYMPKGLIPIMGLSIAEQQLFEFKAAGIENVHVIAKGIQNRRPLSLRFSDGSDYGLRIYYSSPADDTTNNGSGDAILTYILKNHLRGDTICLANDNIYGYDPRKVVEAHRDLGAVVTILTTRMPPRSTIETYGIINVDENHRATAITEKPKDDEDIVRELGLADSSNLSNIRSHVNSAGYILNGDALDGISREKWVIQGRKKESGNFDMAGKLIYGLIRRGYPVFVAPIDAWGDFGSTITFLDTFPEALNGKFSSIYKTLESSKRHDNSKNYYHDTSKNVWVHYDTMRTRNSSGKTFENRMATGRVKIGDNVFIGRGVEIEDDAEIIHSDVEKYSRITRGANLERVYLSPWSQIGSFARLRDCALGLDIVVDSSEASPTYINGRSILGPGIYVPQGTRLVGTTVFPAYRFEKGGEIHKDVVLKPSDEQVLAAVKPFR